MSETFIVKVTVSELLKLLENAKNKETLGQCLNLFADAPPDSEVVLKIDQPKISCFPPDLI